MSMNLAIHIEKKTFPRNRQRPVLRDIHFEVAEAEFVALIGPSGCGKSTLLNILAGLDDDFHGSVDWPSGGNTHRLGYVFQNPRLLPWLTVRDNIRLVIDDPAKAGVRVDSLLDAMGLGRYADYHPGRISIGMQRRVALARAFAIEPQLLLMDEAFSSLDAPTAGVLRSLLLQVWSAHRSCVLFVTHDLREATQLADRILFLSPSPASVIAEAEVAIPRTQRMDSGLWDHRYRELQKQFDTLYKTGGPEGSSSGYDTTAQPPVPRPNPCRENR